MLSMLHFSLTGCFGAQSQMGSNLQAYVTGLAILVHGQNPLFSI